jgi:hypothetical protein
MAEAERPSDTPEHGPVHEYAEGEVQSYEGSVNWWLLVVYAVLGVWAVYYLFIYWGGLGPGLAR